MEPKFRGRWSILLTFENYRIGIEARFLTARGHQPACSSPSFFSAHGQNGIGSRAPGSGTLVRTFNDMSAMQKETRQSE
jgi:hypothetical protein